MIYHNHDRTINTDLNLHLGWAFQLGNQEVVTGSWSMDSPWYLQRAVGKRKEAAMVKNGESGITKKVFPDFHHVFFSTNLV